MQINNSNITSGSALINHGDLGTRKLLKFLLEMDNWIVEETETETQFLDKFDNLHPDAVLFDLYLPASNSYMDGLALVSKLLEAEPDLIVIILTTHEGKEYSKQAVQKGAYNFIFMENLESSLGIMLQNSMKYKNLQRQNKKLLISKNHQTKFEIIANSESMVKAIEIINHAKETDGNVLITGEYGTGKNHIARAIHNKGNRKEKAFIFMNCRHLNSYFQNEKAFEENIKNYSYFQDEIFKKASGGTLFLEDIDMLSSNAQLSLLQKIYEIDELTKIKIQGNNRILRIVSTTCIPIKDLVLQGKFENELFHKIAEIYIELAPLKNRKEDIPLLVEHFMKEIALERGIEVPQISNLAMESLEKYTWPNNISELERILRKIISLKQKNESINLKDIPKEILEEVSLPKESTPDFLRIDSDSVLRSNVLEGGVSLARLLDQMEESFLEAAYRLAKGNKKSAAKLLSMHDKTFLHKFNKKFDLKNKLEPKK